MVVLFFLVHLSISDKEPGMTDQYRLMVYFAIATLHLYRADIVAVRGPQTPEEFADRNKDVVKRVQDEALNVFHYELSSEQMGRAIIAFLAPGQSVAKTAPATMP